MTTQSGASHSTIPNSPEQKGISTPTSQFKEFKYDTLRNISCPHDKKNRRKILTGHCHVSSILSFSTNKNVRDYLADAIGKKRKTYTQVHRAIARTLRENAEDFNVLNGGRDDGGA